VCLIFRTVILRRLFLWVTINWVKNLFNVIFYSFAVFFIDFCIIKLFFVAAFVRRQIFVFLLSFF
jgi:hypothetical protein